jgi:hypothetical protein
MSQVAATGSTASSTALGPASLDPKPVGRTADILADVEPTSATGTVVLYEDDGGSLVELDSAALAYDYLTGTTRAHLTLAADLPAGAYHLVAVYSGDVALAPSESSPVDVTVGPRPTATTVSVSGPHDLTGATAQQGDVLTVGAQVVDAGSPPAFGLAVAGTVTILVDGASVGTIVAPSGQLDVPTSGWTVASHVIEASYDGDGVDHSGSSAEAGIALQPTAVDATGIGVRYGTFYPVKDGYRDVDVIRGNRLESAAVTIRIYNSSGKRIRKVSIASGVGWYRYRWNGHTSSGSLLPAGTYTVVQVLANGHGARTVVRTQVRLSHKRLYTYTKSMTRKGSAVYAVNGFVSVSTTDGWAKLRPVSTGSSNAVWQLSLPAAIVYRSITFRAYVKTTAGIIGMQNFEWCGGFAWANCFDRWKTIGSVSGSLAWFSTGGSVTANRSGRLVRGIVSVSSHPAIVYKVRVTVRYAILK